MSHRTQITLTDDQYDRLRAEARRTGLGLAELVRRALEQSYGTLVSDKAITALDKSFGAWEDRDLDGAAYVEKLRRGMARRIGA